MTAQRAVLGVMLMAAWLPSAAAAQTVARTFADLPSLLKAGDYVVLVDRSSGETFGQVADISSRALTVARVVRTKDRLTTADRRVFAEDAVGAIFRSDATGARGAGVYPASWALAEALPPGSELTVVLASGERRQYRAAGAIGDSLRVLTASGQEERLAKSDVLRVERRRVDDPVGNGIAIGALAGAGVGAGLMAAAYAACDAGCEAPAEGPMFLGAMSMGAGVGAVIGWLADRAHKGRAVVFPVVTRERKAVAISMRF